MVSLVRKIRGQKVNIDELHDVKKMKSQGPRQPFDIDFIKRIEERLDKMPVSAAGRFYRKAELKLAIISDEFLYNTYKDNWYI